MITTKSFQMNQHHSQPLTPEKHNEHGTDTSKTQHHVDVPADDCRFFVKLTDSRFKTVNRVCELSKICMLYRVIPPYSNTERNNKQQSEPFITNCTCTHAKRDNFALKWLATRYAQRV